MKIISREFSELESGIGAGFVKTFASKSAAIQAAKEFGWAGRVLRVARRFETIWIVGALDFQPDELGSLQWDVIRIPELKQAAEQRVLKCRRFRKQAA